MMQPEEKLRAGEIKRLPIEHLEGIGKVFQRVLPEHDNLFHPEDCKCPKCERDSKIEIKFGVTFDEFMEEK